MTLASQRLVETVRAAVAVVGHDQQVAGFQELHHDVQRRHPRCRDHRACAAFERGQRLAECVAGRVAGARVVVLALLPETGEGVIGGQVQRRHDGAMLRVRLYGRAHRARCPGCF